MRVAIVHYHLAAGGVTRVIENAIASLQSHEIKTLVISGEPYPGERLSNVQVVEGLGYRESVDSETPEILANDLVQAARKGLTGELPDVWHFHNHSLGKNIALPLAINQLLEKGHRVLFQIHDFAEDGRPDNYRILTQNHGDLSTDSDPGFIYPIAPQIHYAALNGRDLKFLKQAGTPENQLHLLQNPISPPRESNNEIRPIQLSNGQRIFLYPTRAIRRKNIGEFIFWSALANENDLFATTLRPQNPRWRSVHDRWVAFSESLKLPVRFGVVENTDYSYDQWIANAHSLVTTSVAEGFGLSFLEPWVLEKQLHGRDLPEITADFVAVGIDLSHLYRQLKIPRDFFDASKLRHKLERALKDYYNFYNRILPSDAIDRAHSAIVAADGIDFGFLDEKLQEEVIKEIIQSTDLRRAIIPHSMDTPEDRNVVMQNKKRVANAFSLDAYGRRLVDIYRKVAESEPDKLQSLNADRLLDCFLDPARFCLLRS